MSTTSVAMPIEVRVYDRTGTGAYVVLQRRSGVRFMEELNGVGSGEVTVPLDYADAGALGYGAVVKFAQADYWDDARPFGGQVARMREVAAFVVESREFQLVNGDGLRTLSVSGRGLKSWLENGMVLPFDGYNSAGSTPTGAPQDTTWTDFNRVRAAGPNPLPNVVPLGNAKSIGALQRTDDTTRYSGWMSAPTSWMNPADWSLAMGVAINDPSAAKWHADETGAPVWGPDNWPDKDAQWIWPTPGPGVKVPAGRALFRATLTLAATTTVSFFAAADDTLRLFIDEQQVAAGAGWPNTYTAQLVLGAGDHIIAANVDNHFFDYGDNDPSHNSPGGLMFAAIDADTGGVLLRSDAYNWQSAGAYPIDATNFPGPSTAGVFIELLDEAADRGATGVVNLSRSFSETTDSTGYPWTDHIERSFQVGSDLLNVSDQLAESSFDVRVTPDLIVHARVKLGDDWYSNAWQVQLQPRMNLLTYQWTENGNKPRTSLVAHDQQGWYNADSAAGLSEFGPIEGYVETGNSSSPFETRRLLAATLPGLAKLDHVATATILAVQGCVPLWDFHVGDIVAAPDQTGALVPMEVLSISAEENEAGTDTLWSVELHYGRTNQEGAVRLAGRAGLSYRMFNLKGSGVGLDMATTLVVDGRDLTVQGSATLAAVAGLRGAVVFSDQFTGTGSLDPLIWQYGAAGQFNMTGTGYAQATAGSTVYMALWGGAIMWPLDGNRRVTTALKFNGSSSAAIVAVAAKGSDHSALLVRFGTGSGTSGTVGIRYFNPGGSYLTPSGWTDVSAPAGYQGQFDAGFNAIQIDYYPSTNRVVVVVNGTTSIDHTFTGAPWAGYADQTGYGVGMGSLDTSQQWDYFRVVAL